MSPGERRRRRFDNPDTWSFNDTAASPPATSWNLLRLVFKFIHKAFGYVPLHEKLQDEGALTPPKAGRLRLATWNVWNLKASNQEDMDLKLDNMAAVITLSKCDIVVMQEIKVNSDNYEQEYHETLSPLLTRLQHVDKDSGWSDQLSDPSRSGRSTSKGKTEGYSLLWKRARVRKELGEDLKVTAFIYDERGRDYSTSFLEDTKWAEYDGTRHDVIFADEDGKRGSARRPAYFYLKGEKGAIVIATVHNSFVSKLKEKNEHGTKDSILIRMKQLEHVDWLLPGQPVDKTKVLFALMGDFNEPHLDRPGLLRRVKRIFTKEYSKKVVHLEKFWAGCDKVGLRRCSSDNLKTAVKNGTHYDDIFVTGDFDAPAACFPTYEDLEWWGGWKQFTPAEYNKEWPKFISRVLSDHLLVYADVSPPKPLGFWGHFVNVVNFVVGVATAVRGRLTSPPTMSLHDACKKGNIGVVRQWLNRGPDVNQAAEQGRTSLFVACREGHVDAAQLLLDKGADVNKANSGGATPLFIACQEGHVDAARLLLDNGADVNRARENATPLAISKQQGHSSIVALLEEHQK